MAVASCQTSRWLGRLEGLQGSAGSNGQNLDRSNAASSSSHIISRVRSLERSSFWSTSDTLSSCSGSSVSRAGEAGKLPGAGDGRGVELGSARRRERVQRQTAARATLEGSAVISGKDSGSGVGVIGSLVANGTGGGAAVLDATANFIKSVPKGKTSISRIMEPVEDDLQMLNENLKTVVGQRHPMLMSAAEQIFSAGGKRMRPALVFLVARGTAELGQLPDLLPQHRRLAEITEMIHTASLIHDDVLDNSDMRRGKLTVHQKFGTRVAVLAGDFLFAQSSWFLANLDNLDVIKLISRVIADFANGEIAQKASQFDCDLTQEEYLEKSYAKTASLIAASLKSAAIFSQVSPAVCEKMFDYGKHLGLAFQVVDDILDFTQSTEQLGKPAGSDLASGNLTAPVLFALRRHPRLRELIDSEFVEEGSLQEAIEIVRRGGGIAEAQVLAQEQAQLARDCLTCLPAGPVRTSLDNMVDYVLERLY